MISWPSMVVPGGAPRTLSRTIVRDRCVSPRSHLRAKLIGVVSVVLFRRISTISDRDELACPAAGCTPARCRRTRSSSRRKASIPMALRQLTRLALAGHPAAAWFQQLIHSCCSRLLHPGQVPSRCAGTPAPCSLQPGRLMPFDQGTPPWAQVRNRNGSAREDWSRVKLFGDEAAQAVSAAATPSGAGSILFKLAT